MGNCCSDTTMVDVVLEDLSLRGVAELIRTRSVENIIVMSGAGISCSAGIPDFRSPGTGLYHNLQKYDLPFPEAVFDLQYFQDNPRPFFLLANELLPGQYTPTPFHRFVATLHKKRLLLRNWTQNIDGLERIAGVPEDMLVEAHGTFAHSHCSSRKCRARFDTRLMREHIRNSKVPVCRKCGSPAKPDITFFGEPLPKRFDKLVKSDFKRCDLLIVAGTSLQVDPFASLVDKVPDSCPRVLLNRDMVAEDMFQFCDRDNYRDVFIRGDADDSILRLVAQLGSSWSVDAIRHPPRGDATSSMSGGGDGSSSSTSGSWSKKGKSNGADASHRGTRPDMRRRLKVGVKAVTAAVRVSGKTRRKKKGGRRGGRARGRSSSRGKRSGSASSSSRSRSPVKRRGSSTASTKEGKKKKKVTKKKAKARKKVRSPKGKKKRPKVKRRSIRGGRGRGRGRGGGSSSSRGGRRRASKGGKKIPRSNVAPAPPDDTVTVRSLRIDTSESGRRVDAWGPDASADDSKKAEAGSRSLSPLAAAVSAAKKATTSSTKSVSRTRALVRGDSKAGAADARSRSPQPVRMSPLRREQHELDGSPSSSDPSYVASPPGSPQASGKTSGSFRDPQKVEALGARFPPPSPPHDEASGAKKAAKGDRRKKS